jgi:hypothetical protein
MWGLRGINRRGNQAAGSKLGAGRLSSLFGIKSPVNISIPALTRQITGNKSSVTAKAPKK